MSQTKLQCVIIDNGHEGIEIIEDYISTFDNIEVQKAFTSSIKAISYINQMKTIDIVFLEADMPYLSGFDVALAIKGKVSKIIFTASDTKHAFEALENEADGYLLKPISFAKFSQTISKIVSTTTDLNHKKHQEYFYVRLSEQRNVISKINFKDIIAIEGVKNYIKIYTQNGNINTYLTLKEIKQELANELDFLQIHRSFIISTKNIEKIEGNIIKMTNNLAIQIGPSFKEDFFVYLNQKLIKTGRYEPVTRNG